MKQKSHIKNVHVQHYPCVLTAHLLLGIVDCTHLTPPLFGGCQEEVLYGQLTRLFCGESENSYCPPPCSSNVPVLCFFPRQLDHFNAAEARTFQQRYLVNTQNWAKGGPIFFYTGNEGDITWFSNNTASPRVHWKSHVLDLLPTTDGCNCWKLELLQ